MIARRLSIDPALLVSMFSRPDAWRAVANRLPEDARVDRVYAEDQSWFRGNGTVGKRYYIEIWITSSVFREDDPVDLPAVEFKAIHWFESAPYDPNVQTTNSATCLTGNLEFSQNPYPPYQGD